MLHDINASSVVQCLSSCLHWRAYTPVWWGTSWASQAVCLSHWRGSSPACRHEAFPSPQTLSRGSQTYTPDSQCPGDVDSERGKREEQNWDFMEESWCWKKGIKNKNWKSRLNRVRKRIWGEGKKKKKKKSQTANHRRGMWNTAEQKMCCLRQTMLQKRHQKWESYHSFIWLSVM